MSQGSWQRWNKEDDAISLKMTTLSHHKGGSTRVHSPRYQHLIPHTCTDGDVYTLINLGLFASDSVHVCLGLFGQFLASMISSKCFAMTSRLVSTFCRNASTCTSCTHSCLEPPLWGNFKAKLFDIYGDGMDYLCSHTVFKTNAALRSPPLAIVVAPLLGNHRIVVKHFCRQFQPAMPHY